MLWYARSMPIRLVGLCAVRRLFVLVESGLVSESVLLCFCDGLPCRSFHSCLDDLLKPVGFFVRCPRLVFARVTPECEKPLDRRKRRRV